MRSNQRGKSKCTSNRCKLNLDLATNKGQITIFIIIGIIVAGIFFFVISTSTEIQNDKLQSEKEKVVTKVFRKEALRIAVDDCLKDEMSHALITLGKQGGKFWAGEPGGTEAFQEGINGITVPSADGESKVMYGITKGGNNYPCIDGATVAGGQPKCLESYQFPSQAPDVGYGNRPLLTKGYIESQLQSYMVARGGTCVERVLKEKVNQATEIIKSEPKIEVTMTDEGINVKANYEMTLKIAGVEQFELTQFDFTYPTAFNRFLRAAVTNPLKWDWKYADFKFDQAPLTDPLGTFAFASPISIDGANCAQEAPPLIPNHPLFKCHKPTFQDDWAQLQIQLVKREAQATPARPANSGDDLFIYTLPAQMIVSGAEEAVEQYEFIIARQNRPPALDHISRNPCPGPNGYDYLVVPGSNALAADQTPLDKIEIIPRAYDPDEDVYPFPSLGEGNEQISIAPAINAEGKILNPLLGAADANGIYTLAVTAKDKHGAPDIQRVKIYIDQGLSTSLTGSLLMDPSTVVTSGDLRTLTISKEDPLLITIQAPADSPSRGIVPQVKVIYRSNDNPNNEIILVDVHQVNAGEQTMFGIPTPIGGGSGIDIEEYRNNIETIVTELSTIPLKPGKIEVQYTATYCRGTSSEFSQTTTSSIPVDVVACINHISNDYPFAYPFNGIKVISQEPSIRYGVSRPVNPFLASHSCCSGDNKFTAAPVTITLPDCYGRTSSTIEYEKNAKNANPSKFSGFVLENPIGVCTNRGNMFTNTEYDYHLDQNNKIQCGKHDISTPNCKQTDNAIGESICKTAYEFVNGDHFCVGNFGCNKVCKAPNNIVVYTEQGAVPDVNSLNTRLKEDTFIDPDGTKFDCTCTGHDGRPCDSNFNGNFAGTCERSNCIGDDEADPSVP